MKVLVTGCAGFIGSHLSDRLLAEGHEVIGFDSLTDTYDVVRKRRNMTSALTNPRFAFHEVDLVSDEIGKLTQGVEIVYHLAGQPGVRLSWGKNFQSYVRNNVEATQNLLEAFKARPLKRFVYASSSSIYGDTDREIFSEADVPSPFSPYGVTKLAGEHLVFSYHRNFGLPAVALRFFTVFGPRQRPDMAFQRIIEAALSGEKFTLFGDGKQVRDFTYVADIVDGCIRAAEKGNDGTVYNLGGTNHVSMLDVLSLTEELIGKLLNIERTGVQKGDVRRTHADIGRAKKDFGYAPKTDLRKGLSDQIEFEGMQNGEGKGR